MNDQFALFKENQNGFSNFGYGFDFNQQEIQREEEFDLFQFKKSNSGESYTYGLEDDLQRSFSEFNFNKETMPVATRPIVSRDSSKNSSDKYFSEFESSLEEENFHISDERQQAQYLLRTEANIFQPRMMKAQNFPPKEIPFKEMQHKQFRQNPQHLAVNERAPTFMQHNQQQHHLHQQQLPQQPREFMTQYQMQQMQQQQQQMSPRPLLLPHQQPRIQPKSQQRAMEVNGVPVRRSNGRPSVNERSIVYQVFSALCFTFVNLM